MLTKLIFKSTFLLNIYSYSLLFAVIFIQRRLLYTDGTLINHLLESLIFFGLLSTIIKTYNDWIIKHKEYYLQESLHHAQKDNMHMFLFPSIISILPLEIYDLKFILAFTFMLFAFRKLTAFIFKPINNFEILKCGIFVGVFTYLIGPLFIYGIYVFCGIFLLSRGSFDKIVSFLIPVPIIFFLFYTTNTFFNLDIPAYQNMEIDKNYYQFFKEIKGIIFLIYLFFTGFLFFLINPFNLLMTERRIYFGRLAFLILTITFVYYIKNTKALLIFIPSIIFSKEILISKIKNFFIKELFLWTILLFTIISIIYPF